MASDLRMFTFPKSMNIEARRQLLLGDLDIEVVEEHQVFCRLCKKWVVLRQLPPYNLWNWKQHKFQANHLVMIGKTSAPAMVQVHKEPNIANVLKTSGKRLTTDERHKLLVSDPHTAAVEPRRVFCGPCRKWIALRKAPQPPYFLQTWKAHILKQNHVRRSAAHQHVIRDDLSEIGKTQSSCISLDSPQASPAPCASSPVEEQPSAPPRTEKCDDSLAPPCNVPAPPRTSLPSPRTGGTLTEVDDDVDLSNANVNNFNDREIRSTQASGSRAHVLGSVETLGCRHTDIGPPWSQVPEPDSSEINPIIDYIKENLGPSANFTQNDITTAARVIRELVNSGAMQTELEDTPLY